MSETSIVRIKPHAVLTRECVIEIYRYKIENVEVVSAVGRHACILAAKYGVSEKTIRDIWTARTWSEETSILDPKRHKSANESVEPTRYRAGENEVPGELRPQVSFKELHL